jgi:hypothetical protein
MQDSDAPEHEAHIHMADLSVVSKNEILLDGKPVTSSPMQVALNAPIILEVQNLDLDVKLTGRNVSLSFKKALANNVLKRAAVLIDNSGSMGQIAHAQTPHVNLLMSAISGLRLASEAFQSGDEVEVWQFNSSYRRIGVAKTRQEFLSLLEEVQSPMGDTKMTSALQAMKAAGLRNILVVTDANTWDVSFFSDVRLSALVIGEDAMAGHLADICMRSGGEIFEAPNRSDDTAILAFNSLRRSSLPSPIIKANKPLEIHDLRSGIELKAIWSSLQTKEKNDIQDAVTAIATQIAFNALSPNAAAAFAEENGLVTSVTSLVIVDEEGETFKGLADVRKVALSTPLTRSVRMMPKGMAMITSAYSGHDGGSVHSLMDQSMPLRGVQQFPNWSPETETQKRRKNSWGASAPVKPASTYAANDLAHKRALFEIAQAVDWNNARSLLDDPSSMPSQVFAKAKALSEMAEYQTLAKALRKNALLIVLARAAETIPGNRAAMRFSRSVLGGNAMPSG